ncbi:MAG: hypothetical protein FWH48_04950, partial [Oscillospiraceae bacterium]|nr:hypothetical protein [Oscillospiraceae bacterium]
MPDKIQVFVISNTHWDREWYLPLEKYMVRLVKLMDRLFSAMEKYPEYRFVTDGQYIMLGDYLQARPEMRSRAKKLIGEGRLLVGPWYTQPLETLVTGEGMVRNLYYGMTETEKFGPPMKFSYMIDQFGHASQTPQILKGFGINDAMSWRGIENKARDVFLWSAPNGDSVFMHRSVHGYGDAVAMPESMDNFKETVDGHIFDRSGLKERIKRIKSLKDEFSPSGVQFWLNGVDHSWAQENILEIIEKINREFPEYSAKQSSLEEYAAAVHMSYKAKNIPMQKYSGEQIHPDEQILVCAHSTRADEKKRHWLAERLLEKRAEPMSALAWLMGEEYPMWALKDAWRHILENHAHDSLDCCSVDEVYDRVMARYTSSISLSEQLTDDAFCYLMSVGGESDWNTLYIFNTNSNAYEGVVVGEIDIPTSLLPEDFDIADKSTGEKIEFSVLGTEEINAVRYNAFYGHPSRIPKKRHRVVLDIGKIGGFSMKSYALAPKERNGDKAAPRPSAKNTLENEFFLVEIRPNGTIDVFDKLSKIQYANLMQLADSGDCGSIWVHRCPKNNTIITNENVVAQITKLGQNELVTEYMVKYSLDIPEGYDCISESRSKKTCALDVAIKISLTKNARYIGVEIELDNRARFHQLRALFCSGASEAAISLSGQPFDVVERKIGIPEGFDFDIDPNCEYHPMQDFCAVTDQSRGLLVAAKGIFEYEAINDAQKTLALTLLRSTCFDFGADDNIGGYNMEKSYMLGKIKHELAIMPFAKDWREAYPYVAGYVNPPQLSFKKD